MRTTGPPAPDYQALVLVAAEIVHALQDVAAAIRDHAAAEVGIRILPAVGEER